MSDGCAALFDGFAHLSDCFALLSDRFARVSDAFAKVSDCINCKTGRKGGKELVIRDYELEIENPERTTSYEL